MSKSVIATEPIERPLETLRRLIQNYHAEEHQNKLAKEQKETADRVWMNSNERLREANKLVVEAAKRTFPDIEPILVSVDNYGVFQIDNGYIQKLNITPLR